MRRPPVLLAFVVLAATIARAWIAPVHYGVLPAGADADRLGIAAPFGDDLKGSSDAFLSLQARSLLREGVVATGGVPLLNVGKAEPNDFFYYDHHPPGVALATAAAFALFGEGEGVARGVALLFATLTLAIVAGFVRRCAGAGDRAALLAVVAMASLPIGMYWATHLDYFVPAIAACSAFLVLALRDAPTQRTTVLAAVALVVAMSLDSLAALAAVAVSVERLVFGPRRKREGSATSGWLAILGWPLLAAAVGLSWAAWMSFQVQRHGHNDGDDRLAYLLHAMMPGIGWGEFLPAIERHLRALVGGLGELLLVAGAIPALGSWRRSELARFWRASVLLALGAGMIPREQAFTHVYFQLYWILPLGASAALLAANAMEAAGRWPGKWRVAVPRLWIALFAGALIVTGLLLLPERTPRSDRPSSALLGLELATKVSPEVRVIALPVASSFNDFVPSWYSRRVVLRADTRTEKAVLLDKFGIPPTEEIPRFKDPDWPSRSAFAPLAPK